MTAHTIRPYDAETDFDAVVRIWQEIGWMDTSAKQIAGLAAQLDCSHNHVATIDGEAECCTSWTPGSIRCQSVDLSMAYVAAVTTSRIGRKLGFATNLTALALAEAADAGMATAVLGIFDQGFYDRLGFGTGSYERTVRFDPARLKAVGTYRTPVRVSVDDWADVSAAMRHRHLNHGSVVIDAPDFVQAELTTFENPFGLGYRDDTGRLTHFVLGQAADADAGPYNIRYLAYETREQFLELMRVVRELGDQVHLVSMLEPPGIQIQDLLEQPLRDRDRSRGATLETTFAASAWWQIRILDLDACVAARTWRGPEFRFNLMLSDPMTHLVDEGWNGVAGDYTVTIGEVSGVAPGHTSGLAHLETSVGAFSRCLFGVRPASSLAITDDLTGPADLLTLLDESIGHPTPHIGWNL